MKKTLLGLMMLTLCAGPARAETGTIALKVKGMVCSFCAQGIKKKMAKHPEVAAVDVDLEEKRVELTMKEGQDLPDDVLKKEINDAGYDIVEIRREKKK